MKMKCFLTLCLPFVLALSATGYAQTTLSGDHVVDGDLTVGTSTNKSAVVINGETGVGASPSLSIYSDGIVQFWKASSGGTASPVAPGTRFYWDPNKAILRVGYLSLEQSENAVYSDPGQNSTAFGDSIAIGEGSFAAAGGTASGRNAFAVNGTAGGNGAFAAGGYVDANDAFSVGGYVVGEHSVAFYADAMAPWTFAAMYGIASGYGSIALGGSANGEGSVALSGEAWADYAFGAAGGAANEYHAIALGGLALGRESVAIGTMNTIAFSAGSFVIGQRNSSDSSQSSTEWRDQDELFVIGNGTGKPSDPPEVQNRNALVVRKSGDITIPKRQGDILMGEFGNPE